MPTRNLLTSILSAAMLLSASQVHASGSSDPYINGLESYAKENPDMKGAMQSYMKEIAQAEKQAGGYIGSLPTLPAPTKVMDGVYTVVGSLIWHKPENYGLNNNLSWVEFADGVFVFNAGPNPAVAKAFHKMIQQYTDKPVKWVAVENSQGHAYLGASYWYDVGVRNFYSNERANGDFDNGFDAIKGSWARRVGESLTQGARNMSDKFTTFDDKLTLDVGGGETIEFLSFGPGHTPGSTLAYIPSKNLLFTGDVAYNTRSLAFFSYTNTGFWIDTFKAMKAAMPANVVVIPGHGAPTDMATVTRDTLGYLEFLHAQVKKKIAEGGTEADMGSIDQSAYAHRPVFAQTAAQNAVHVYRELTGGDLGESNE